MMTMTRKHYREVAEVISNNLRFEDAPDGKDAIAGVAQDLAAMFKRDNSNFRYDTFYQACGLDIWGNVVVEEPASE